jgi:5-bromo-4-chloroindolyl phosphate hydrolysis protein
MAKEDKIPLYTSVGIKVTVILMLLLGLMILKNCVSSIIYGTATDDRAIQQYYEMGYTVGEKQARNEATEKKPQIDNPLLNKAYQRGFREGWDSQQPQKTLEE